MSGPLWSSAELDEGVVRQVADTYGLPLRVARVLCTRVDSQHIGEWLDPSALEYTNPSVFLDMDVAVARIREAVRTGERIGIIGDYDVDGVTSSAILATTFEELGADFECYIPHRVDDGYGLSTDLVDRAQAGGCRLLVTVDNGIRANEAVRYAVEQGMQVIVTDHHEPGDELPGEAVAIVHHTRAKDGTVSILSGAGVAWKLATALLDGTDTRELQHWHLGLAALGALADIMPMKGENRRLVREGITLLQTCARPGWLALCEVAGVNPSLLGEQSVLWSITPRINAAGRMDTAESALRLLLARDAVEASDLAGEVEETNAKRRRETTRSTEEATAVLERLYTGGEVPPVLVVAGPWPLGVVGIVAAKLADLYHRPTIVFAEDGGHLLRGSGRAPDGYDFHEAVSRCTHLLEHFGGHSTALGCGILQENLDTFREALCTAMSDMMALSSDGTSPNSDRMPVVADDYLPLSEATLELAKRLEQLGPFGPGYPPYKFYVGPVTVVDVMAMGAGKHLRLTVREGSDTMKLIWFNPPSFAFQLKKGSLFSAVVALEVNTWQGRQQPQLRAHAGWLLSQPVLRDDFAKVYRLLHARRKLVANDVAKGTAANAEAWVQTIFDTFVDLGFAYFKESAYHVVEQAQTRDLRESIVYQAHLRSVAQGEEAIGQ